MLADSQDVECLQTFAEKLFVRLQKSSGEKMETRTAMITLISRIVGVHKLILLNFYPFLQRYLQPHQRDVTTLLAALIQVLQTPVHLSLCLWTIGRAPHQDHEPAISASAGPSGCLSGRRMALWVAARALTWLACRRVMSSCRLMP